MNAKAVHLVCVVLNDAVLTAIEFVHVAFKDALVGLDARDYSRVICGHIFFVIVEMGQEPNEELLMRSKVSVHKCEKGTLD